MLKLMRRRQHKPSFSALDAGARGGWPQFWGPDPAKILKPHEGQGRGKWWAPTAGRHRLCLLRPTQV